MIARLAALLVLLFSLPAASLPASAEPAPLRTVAAVDLDRYTGLWREAARLPNRMEEGCVGALIRYTRQPDGFLIHSECRKQDGRSVASGGRARVTDASRARLKVGFGPIALADYWIVDVAPDYSWAIVGEPRRRYLWVLTRAPTPPPALRAELAARIDAHGYSAAQLIWNPE